MKRILMMVLRNIIFVPYMWCKLCYHASHVHKYTEEEHLKMLKYIVYRANKGGNVKIEVHGKENIPKENGFIMFPNHQGMYDMLALIYITDKPLSVVAKKEVGNIPFLKQVFSCINAKLMDREDIKQSLKVIIEVSKEVAKGRNYVIFPEGTRSKMGNKLGEFKGGSFKAATKVKCPIVPVALIDAYKPFDSNSISNAVVQVHILKPLLYEDYKDMKTTEIDTYTHDLIQKTIDEKLNK